MNRVQNDLLMMMRELDVAMREAGVEYYMYAGTCLGAIRHKGFIPWDDDMDICITPEFESKLDDVMKHLPEGKYFLQRPLSQDWPRFSYKVRLNNTRVEEENFKKARAHQGLFIDIFVMRDFPTSRPRQALHRVLHSVLRALAHAANHTYGNDSLDPVQKTIFGLMRSVYKLMHMLPEKDTEYVWSSYLWNRVRVPKKVFTEPIDRPFETCTFLCFEDFDPVLKAIYGDYMQLPSEEDRKKGSHITGYCPDVSGSDTSEDRP